MIDIEKLADKCIDREADPPDENCGCFAFYPNELKAFADAVAADIIDQARCLVGMIDPVMGDMYCRGWKRALETLEKSILRAIPAQGRADINEAMGHVLINQGLPAQEEGECCEWKERHPGLRVPIVDTQCGKTETVKKTYKFCPYCGLPIKIKE